ncbi:MAG TPA: VWA domain-containing protein [Thermoanaerobaculia bacterium]
MRIASLLLVAVLALPLLAQHQDALTVEVVEVPVYVWRNATPVTGLTRENFELLVDGKPQKIDYFDVVDTGSVRVASGTRGGEVVAEDLRERRLFLLLFDLTFSRPVAVQRAHRAAAELIEKSAPGDVYAVAVFTPTEGIRFLTPFTTDREPVLTAVGAVRGRTTEHPMRTLVSEGSSGAALGESRQTPDAETAGGRSGRGPGGGGGGGRGGEIEAARAQSAAQVADLQEQPIKRQHEMLLQDFRDTARRLAPLEGQKHVVLFSEGPSIGMKSSYTLQLVEQLHHTFQEANAFLHAVDISGLRHTFTLGENASLHMLASATGGMVLQNSNDLGALLTEMHEVHRYAYVLGFSPRGARRGHNAIEVKLRGVDNATVSYRRGFSTDREKQSLDGLRVADILLNNIPQSGIRASVAATPNGLRIVIPASAGLVSKDVEVMLYVFDEAKKIVESRHLLVKVEGKPRTIDAKLPLPEGRYAARVLLVAGESLGLTNTEFTVR